MTVPNLLKLSMLLSQLSDIKLGPWSGARTTHPCNNIECPTYNVLHSGDGYEIRSYNSRVWAVSSPIYDNSFVNATITGFKQLFSCIQGENKYKQKIEMTAPVLTEVAPFCKLSGFLLVSFYVPKENQADPPPATGITFRKGSLYVVARQFG